MFTTIDKAIVAFIMAGLFIAQWFFEWAPAGISEDTIATLVSVATPFLVYLVPNKKPAEAPVAVAAPVATPPAA